MSSKPLWQSITIKVPEDMITITKTGQVRIRPTLTKTKNLSKANGKTSLDIKTTKNNVASIETNSKLYTVNELKDRNKKLKQIKSNLDNLPKKQTIKKAEFTKKVVEHAKENTRNKKLQQIKTNLDNIKTKQTKDKFIQQVRKKLENKTPKTTTTKHISYFDWIGDYKDSIHDDVIRGSPNIGKIYDEMYDLIDNKMDKNDILNTIKALNINIDNVMSYVVNWYDKKEHAGHSAEYSDFVRLVIYPALLKNIQKKQLSTTEKFCLMMYSHEIANERYFDDQLEGQKNKNRVVYTFVKKPFSSNTLQTFISPELHKLFIKLNSKGTF